MSVFRIILEVIHILSLIQSLYRYFVVFVLGGPGSGKGTQCALIAKEYGFTHISAGDELRKYVEGGSPEAQAVQKMMKEGQIVPYEVTLGLLQQAMDNSTLQPPSSNKFVLLF